jgi:hypothetical protein
MEFTEVSAAAETLLFLKNSDPEFIFNVNGYEHFMKERVEMVRYIKEKMKVHVAHKSVLAAKLEYNLFIRARSLHEYNNKETLKKRIVDVVDESRKRCQKTNVL